jgi:ABC-type uncharacterized transport system fused permease/ATPase subunit
LQAPDWVILDDTFSFMEDEALERIIEVFTEDLPRTTIIHIGRSAQAHLPLFSRVLHLTRLPGEADPHEQWATERMLRQGR